MDVSGDPNSLTSFACVEPPPLIAELRYGNSSHYVLTADVTEAYDVSSGKVGVEWTKTGTLWQGWAVGTPGTLPVCRFYYPSTVDGGAHFLTIDEAECEGLKSGASGWIFEGTPFAAKTAASCGADELVISRYYRGDVSTSNVPLHRFLSDAAGGFALQAQGWRYEGDVTCLARFPS